MNASCKTRSAHALAMAALLVAVSAQPYDVVVNMLNTGQEGSMVFEPSYLKVAVGDTFVFKPAQPGGHNSPSLLVPAGATPWSGNFDKETRVQIDKEGVYLYYCQPHKGMSMVRVIQAGKPVNLAAAREAARK